MADYVYPSLARGLMRNSIDLTGKLKVLLVSSKYKPAPEHRCRDDVTYEVKGVGYKEGGIEVPGNKLEDIKDTTALKADPVTWPRVSLKAGGAVVYYCSGAGSKYDELICYCHFPKDSDGQEPSATNGPFTINWDSEGIIVLGAKS